MDMEHGSSCYKYAKYKNSMIINIRKVINNSFLLPTSQRTGMAENGGNFHDVICLNMYIRNQIRKRFSLDE